MTETKKITIENLTTFLQDRTEKKEYKISVDGEIRYLQKITYNQEINYSFCFAISEGGFSGQVPTIFEVQTNEENEFDIVIEIYKRSASSCRIAGMLEVDKKILFRAREITFEKGFLSKCTYESRRKNMNVVTPTN